MTQVLKTLGVLDVNWKKTSAYNVKCRWVARGSSLFENTHSNHGLTDSPMAGSMPRVSSGHWSADQRSMSIPAHAGETDNESSVETNFIKFEVQVNFYWPLTWNILFLNLILSFVSTYLSFTMKHIS